MTGNKILIVEDNPMNRQLAVDLLELSGYEVVQADTAEKGVELAKAESPNLILMDIGLPGIDGLSATKILKNDKNTKDIPVVALTAFAMKGDEEKAMDAGCKGYISKPIDTRVFRKEVARFFEE